MSRRPPRFPTPTAAQFVWSLVCSFAPAAAAAEPPVDFAREIQPILAGRCYDCHGPEKTKGGLQLTTRQQALRGGESGEPAIVANQSARSSLLQRVTTTEEDDVMPQKSARLTPSEIGLLRRWIDEGAVWPENIRHWAYVKPVRPAPPPLRAGFPAALNPIDHFILARLEKEGLVPSPATDRPRWLRRVSFDLIGLPPTPAEVSAFLADTSDQACERVVDRLLASPQYGERWARPWLDLARYADSHGFQRDDLRELWPYRDWVVRALNADLPFDQFTLWQVAGDLLPESTGKENLDPLIATGFHRAAPTNVEAGTDQEEGRVNQVFDRVNTTAAVWLGTTLECAQCHHHKYDPFSQKDYYQLFAFFNNTAIETAFTSSTAMAALKFTGPYVTLPDPSTAATRPAMKARLAELDGQIIDRSQAALAGYPGWEASATASLSSAAQLFPLPITSFESVGGSNYRILPDWSVLLTDDAPDRDTYVITASLRNFYGLTGFKLEVLTDPSLPGTGPGRGDATRPNFVLNNFRATSLVHDRAEVPIEFAQARASFSQVKFPVGNLLKTDNDNRGGWAISPQFRRDHWAIFATKESLTFNEGVLFKFTLEQNFGAGRSIGRLRLFALTGKTTGESLPAEIATILRAGPERRSAAQTAKLRNYHLNGDQTLVELKQARATLVQELAAAEGPRTLVMRELPRPRQTTVLKRGNFLEPGEPVHPTTPALLHPAPASPSPNRLDLARWLVDRENPLVARVTVNRWWAEFFGRGIVTTPEDFGVKGEPPSHPELLDWLAVEFMAGGWSMKHIHRLIALSATYRQTSRLTPELLARDDLNKLLTRGPRFRLDAEAIRDNALAVAGLLSLKQGGPPVRPFQPPGLWESKVGGDRVTYEVSPGEDARRRGLYTVWKRSSPYPSFVNFDATARTACTVRRSRSNTPLQALTLLNDPVYVEAAHALARRILAEHPDTATAGRIRHGFRLCLARAPTPAEVAALQQLFERQSAAHRDETIAWQAVATALLNLDEMITKN